MGIKQKFFMLAGLVGVLMAVISIAGYLTAASALEDSIKEEITAVIENQGSELNGWFLEKRSSVEHTANLMTSYNGDESRIRAHESLSLTTSDKDIIDLTAGTETGYFASYNAGDSTGKKDPTQRPWYQQAKAGGKVDYTDPYEDTNTGKLIISAIAPFYNGSTFIGAICNDITLDEMTEQAKNIDYQGNGKGIIIDKKGEIVASGGDEKAMDDFRSLPGIGDKWDAMLQKGEGFFVFEGAEGKKVFAYTTVPTTGWIVGLSVPYDIVYAQLNHMKMLYGGLVLVGLILVVAACLRFATKITTPIMSLEEHAKELSTGNLCLDDIPVTSSDEIGSLSAAFNTMGHNLRNLIKQMASTSEQVAAASEELTANAQQSADASVHVAETVGEVSSDMDQQLNDINNAKQNVDAMFIDITNMSSKAEGVAASSNETAAAAKEGANLMQEAIHKMGSIEKSVMSSAEVVERLGKASEQIGQIVEAISSIAEQTNLLALNAAIEAARAGEQGRGFAVVAEEVRKLAAESQESAEQIRERIGAIQSETADAVEAMKVGTVEVQEGTTAIREVGEHFTDIMAKVENINQQMTEINTSAQTVSDGATKTVDAVDAIDTISRKTADNTQTISSATEEQSASNEEIAAASQSLANLASDMQAAIGKFKI